MDSIMLQANEVPVGDESTNFEEPALDLNDPEMVEAAMKIQAGLSGFKTRQEHSAKVTKN